MEILRRIFHEERARIFLFASEGKYIYTGCHLCLTKWNSDPFCSGKVERNTLFSRGIPFVRFFSQFHQAPGEIKAVDRHFSRTSFAILSTITRDESLQFRAFLSGLAPGKTSAREPAENSRVHV